MKVARNDPPRRYTAGRTDVEIADCGRVALDPDEQLTFTTPAGGELDVTRKAWGFYATPSLNARLPRFGLRGALVANAQGNRFVVLVESGREDGWESYREAERLEVVEWLDAALHCPFDGAPLELAWAYGARPEGETDFGIADYRRELHRCPACGHFVSRPELGELYGGGYVDATYGDGLAASFERIVALPPERSDNAGRAARVDALARGRKTLLDVGSGLGVFPFAMKRLGWSCTALDPDPRAAAHAREAVGVEAVCGDFLAADGLGRYDVVTLNKVAEHVADPVALLARAREHLAPDGLVYVEVPDGEAAAADGPGREEFFVEHLHVFSAASLALLVVQAGLRVERLERLREPSGKYTLWALAGASLAPSKRGGEISP